MSIEVPGNLDPFNHTLCKVHVLYPHEAKHALLVTTALILNALTLPSSLPAQGRQSRQNITSLS
jgi:hypothetical protein